MEGFSYNNIFETKGLEYLAILIFFAILIPFWIILNRRLKIRKTEGNPSGSLSLKAIRIPRGVFFSKNHTWTFLERSGNAKVGLDDLLLHFTGQVLVKVIKTPGTTVKKGELLAEITQDGKKLNIFSPLSGIVVATNSEVMLDPGVMNEDPYREGWIFKINPENWIEETSTCYFSDKAIQWAELELNRFKDFMAVSLNNQNPEMTTILQDGGEICNNALSAVPEEVWNNFQKEFMS